jgi:hypothetical protein
MNVISAAAHRRAKAALSLRKRDLASVRHEDGVHCGLLHVDNF